MPYTLNVILFVRHVFIASTRAALYLRLTFIFLCAAVFCTSHAQPPDLRFKSISKEQGLSSSTVQCIYQDSQGFIWIGTNDGLNKYDGYKIISYQHTTDSNSISNDNIMAIWEDKQNNIWIGTGYGLNRLNKDKNNFSRYTPRPGQSTFLNNTITGICGGPSGQLWLGTGAGLMLLDRVQCYFIDCGLPGQLSSSSITCLYVDRKNNLWAGTDGEGLHRYEPGTGSYRQFMIGTENTNVSTGSISSNFITALSEGPSGNILIGTKDAGMDLFDPGTGVFSHFRHDKKIPASLSGNVVKSILKDEKGRIWIGVENGGINLWDQPADKFFHYENTLSEPLSLSQKTASTIFEDRQGNLWVGTHRGGVNLYSPDANKFTTYKQGVEHNRLSYKDVKTFLEVSNNTILIGTDGGGINEWNREKKKFSVFRHDPGNASSIGSDAILHIIRDRSGNIRVGTWGGGLNLFNTKDGTFLRFLHKPGNENSISSDNVWRIFEDSKNRLWIGTSYGGLNLFDRKSKKFTRITTDTLHKTSFWGNNVTSINEDTKGNLWFVCDNGLNCLNVATGQFEHYFAQGNNTMPYMGVSVIFVDSRNRLWAAGRGLYLFDYRKKTFSRYSQNPVLSNAHIEAISEDSNGQLWISTGGNGLIRFNPESDTLRVFTDADGLQGLEFNPNACIRTNNGEMLFGGYNGFSVFNPEHIQAEKINLPVYITDFQVFNKSAGNVTALTGNESSKGLVLDHSQSVFSLEYAALNYASPEKIQYAYKLEGFDKNWNYVGRQRKATFTNLDPGNYTFRVKAGTPDGDWNEQIASVNIAIQPAFWMTWWFKTLSVLLILGIVYTILFYRRKFELEKLDKQKTKEIQQLQLQFFTNISHEFRTPLSLISGPLEKIQKSDPSPVNKPYYEMVKRNINRLLQLIGELMDFRKVESGALKLHVSPGELNKLVHKVAEDFDGLAIQKKIHYSVQTDEIIKETWFDHQAVEKIVVNLVHNAFKYTDDGGTITIRTHNSLDSFVPAFSNELTLKSDYKSSRYVYISLTDTGIGISKESIQYLFERYYRITQEHLGSGVGLAFVKSLVLLHKGEIYVYSEKSKGTSIVIGLPAEKKDYEKEERWLQGKQGHVQLESLGYNQAVDPYPGLSIPLTQDSNTDAASTELKKHVLITDDNEEIRLFLKDSLEPFYHIEEASNGKEGLQQAKEKFPDLIISDVMMPVMDGIEFCRLLKEDIEISHIPFILLTAKDALQSRLEGASSGADHYFSKPVNTDLLLYTIRNTFAQREKIKERYSKDYKVQIKDLVHTALDKEFMDKLLALLEGELDNSELGVDLISHKLGMNRTKLNKKIKDLSGQSTNEFIRSFRLKKSMEIMTHENITVTEVMLRVGIQSNSYFTASFKKEFGRTPSQFQQELKKP